MDELTKLKYKVQALLETNTRLTSELADARVEITEHSQLNEILNQRVGELEQENSSLKAQAAPVPEVGEDEDSGTE